MKIMLSCIHFPIWPYPPKIMIFQNYFRPVNCMGWQVCILSKLQLRFFLFFCSHIICADTICAGISTSSHTQDSAYITSPPQGSTGGDLTSLANVLLLFTLWILPLVPVEDVPLDVPFILFVFPFFHFVLEDIPFTVYVLCHYLHARWE